MATTPISSTATRWTHRPAQLLATCDYGGPITAIVADGTALGLQFHPEKSQSAGLRMLANFLRWAP